MFLQKFFACEPQIHDLVGVKLKEKTDAIQASLSPALCEEVNSHVQELKQKLRNVLNNARSRQASLEQSAEVNRLVIISFIFANSRLPLNP